MEAAWWPHVERLLMASPDPWPREMRLMDLRMFADRARCTKQKRPTRKKLGTRWRCSDYIVRRTLLAEDEWASPTRRPVVDRLSTTLRPFVDHSSTTPATTNAENGQNVDHSSTDVRPVVDHPSTDVRPTRVVAEAEAEAEAENKAAGAAGLSGEQAAQPKKPSDLDRVNELWKVHHPRSTGYAKASAVGKTIAARIREHDLDSVLTVISWAHVSRHKRATFLRENGMSMQTLMRPANFAGYLEFAREGSGPTPVAVAAKTTAFREKAIRQEYDMYVWDANRPHDPPWEFDRWRGWMRERAARGEL
ncbi:MAG: hypothetical protein ACI9K2_006631 [Myxococcota bacterium]|jgi:hypothetical protein